MLLRIRLVYAHRSMGNAVQSVETDPLMFSWTARFHMIRPLVEKLRMMQRAGCIEKANVQKTWEKAIGEVRRHI